LTAGGYDGSVIDCDVHHAYGPATKLTPYIQAPWREFVSASTMSLNPAQKHYPHPFGTNKRIDLVDDGGPTPGWDYDLMASQLLDPFNIGRAILNYDVGHESAHNNHYLAAALASALNDWSLDTWLSRGDDRLYGSILVASTLPTYAANEIRRLGAHPRMVGVLMVADGLGLPFGHPIYHPIFEAASEFDLPISLHFGADLWSKQGQLAAGGNPLSRTEFYTLLPQPAMHHITSCISHGVFDKWPNVRLVLLETGYTWLPWLARTLDLQFSNLRRESPFVRNLPSETILTNVRIATQPYEPPEHSSHLIDLLSALDGIEDVIMFSSDYPHWDIDDADDVAKEFPPGWRAKIMYRNAEQTFRWPATGAAGSPSSRTI